MIDSFRINLLGTHNILFPRACFKMIFLFPFGGIWTRSERRVHRVDQIFYVHTFPQMVSFLMIAFSVTLNVHSNEAEIPRALARKSPGLWCKHIHFEMVQMRLWWCCVCLVKKRQSALQQSFHANLIFRRVMNKEDFFFCWRVSLLTDVPPPPSLLKDFPDQSLVH